MEQWEHLGPLIRSGADLSHEVEKRHSELTKLLAPFDAVHLLGQLVLSEMPSDADTYVESEHPGAAHVIEFAAATLLARGTRAGKRAVAPAIDKNTLDPARTLLREMVFLEGLRRYRNAGALSDDPLGGAQGRAAMQHLVIRGPGWPWQECALLLDLFGAAHIATRLRAALGFDAATAVACVEAIPPLLARHISEHAQRAMAEGRDEALAWASETLTGWQSRTEPFRDRALTALWAMTHIGDAMLFTPEDLASEAGVDLAGAAAVVTALSSSFGQANDLFAGAERIRERPYIDVGGRFFCTVPGNDLWALRRLFESALKTGEQYSRHRGRWLERRAGEMLAGALRPDEIHFSAKLVSPDGGGEVGEIDALMRFDDTVIAVEAKGAMMKPGARRGGRSLIDHLSNLTKAAQQGSLALRSLTGQAPVELRTEKGEPLELGQAIREVHPVVVTLEDLSAVAPVIWQVAGTAVLPEDVTIPWVVTLHELAHVCATVEWPQQLVHFLRRRSELNDRADRVATDELDWWMLYLDTSLYFEDEPQRDAPRRYLSLTDPLDAWMLFDHGDRSTPAKKPRQRLDQHTKRLFDTLATERPPGWIAAGCSFLDISGDSRKRVLRDMRAARRKALQRGMVQRGTRGSEDVPGGLLLCWVVVPDEGANVLRAHLEEYVAERFEAHGIQRVLGLGITTSTARPYDALLVAEQSLWNPPRSTERG